MLTSLGGFTGLLRDTNNWRGDIFDDKTMQQFKYNMKVKLLLITKNCYKDKYLTYK